MSLKESLVYPSRSIWGEHSIQKRQLKRHSVERELRGFCGWPTLGRIVEASKTVSTHPLRNGGFIAASFCTGGRVSEVLGLKPSMFSVYKGCKPWLVVVKEMPLLKRYEKTGEYEDAKGKKHYTTKRLDTVRDFSFRVDEPLVKPLLQWVVYALEHQYEWLFPSPYKQGKPLGRKWAFWLVGRISGSTGLPIHPHWFRAMRASHLASEYSLAESSLLEWFQWEKWETAKKYTKLGVLGLAKRMGVKFRKDRGIKVSDIKGIETSLNG